MQIVILIIRAGRRRLSGQLAQGLHRVEWQRQGIQTRDFVFFLLLPRKGGGALSHYATPALSLPFCPTWKPCPSPQPWGYVPIMQQWQRLFTCPRAESLQTFQGPTPNLTHTSQRRAPPHPPPFIYLACQPELIYRKEGEPGQ